LRQREVDSLPKHAPLQESSTMLLPPRQQEGVRASPPPAHTQHCHTLPHTTHSMKSRSLHDFNSWESHTAEFPLLQALGCVGPLCSWRAAASAPEQVATCAQLLDNVDVVLILKQPHDLHNVGVTYTRWIVKPSMQRGK